MKHLYSIHTPTIRLIILLGIAFSFLAGAIHWSTLNEEKDTFLRDIKGFQLLSAFIDQGSRNAKSSAEQYSRRLQLRFPKADDLHSSLIPLNGTVASLTIADDDLNDSKYGIFSNAIKKGFAWERPGLFTLYREGEMVFQSRVGVRIHGGEYSRYNEPEALGFRLYFRTGFGSDGILAATVWPEVPGFLHSLVLVNSTNNLRSAMGMEISRRTGAAAPYATPAQFYLNGNRWYRRFVIMTEHISKTYLETHYDHDDYIFYRYKNDDSKYAQGPYATLLERVKDRDRPLTFKDITEKVDTETLFAQYATYMLVKLYDSFQGGIFLDNKDDNARWTFVSWDMQGGYFTSWGCQMFSDQCPEPMEDYFQHLGNEWGLLRESIWQRFKDDDLFRQEFTHYLAHLFRYQITDEWIADLTDRYRQIALLNGVDYKGDHEYGIASFAASERFITKQKDEILAVVKSQWGIDINAIPDEAAFIDESLSVAPVFIE